MTIFRKRLIGICVLAVVLIVAMAWANRDPCVSMRAERERNSTVLATLDRTDAELAHYIMAKNAALYDQMEREGCKP